MSTNDSTSSDSAIAGRYQVILIIWAAQLMSLFGFFLISMFVFESKGDGNPTTLWLLTGASLMLVAASFPVKQKFFARAVEQQSVAEVQQGQILALALCEAAGLFGLLARAVTGSPYFYLPFIIATLGMLLHFPRRESLAAASFKNKFSGTEEI
jgi:hypothetical protein